ncbi:DUF1444 family protein [Desulforamulus aeronauticus]|uniref:Uncharacterized protein n=1 Tax=Desulforamulus aeronauticus DSM 10349 TaxID=1121421 RepID=A0A1M6VC50_9FIRM|nr:DUF1444 family protein [Desulforamulus aeronauticus]SHK79083.1 Protein of unknown function [Desulforamulus aeronauticus DSM 10349]
MDRQVFRKIVSEYILETVPKSLIYNLDNFAIRMKKGEYWIDLSLENFYRGYCRQNASLRQQYVAEVLAPFIKDLKRESGVNHQDVKENLQRIYPIIVGPKETKGIATTTLAEDLSVAYVLDEGMRIFFIDKPTIDRLEFSLESIHQTAIDNFFRDLVKPLQLFDKNREIYGFNYGDTYDSSRLLSLILSPRQHGLSNSRRLQVMIPNRDVVLLLLRKEESDLRQAMMIGRSSFINNPYPISGKVYELHKGAVTLFQLPWDAENY